MDSISSICLLTDSSNFSAFEKNFRKHFANRGSFKVKARVSYYRMYNSLWLLIILDTYFKHFKKYFIALKSCFLNITQQIHIGQNIFRI